MKTRTMHIHTHPTSKNCLTRCANRLFIPQKISHVFWDFTEYKKMISHFTYTGGKIILGYYEREIEIFDWKKAEKTRIYLKNPYENHQLHSVSDGNIFYTLEPLRFSKSLMIYNVQTNNYREVALPESSNGRALSFNNDLITFNANSYSIFHIDNEQCILKKTFSNFRIPRQYRVFCHLSAKHLLFMHKNFPYINNKTNDLYLLYLHDGSTKPYNVPIPYQQGSIDRKLHLEYLKNNQFVLLIGHKLLLFRYHEEINSLNDQEQAIQLISQIEIGKERNIDDMTISLDEKYLITLENKPKNIWNMMVENDKTLKRWDISTGKLVDEYYPSISDRIEKIMLLPNGNIAYHGRYSVGLIEYHHTKQARKEIIEETTKLYPSLTDIIADYELGVSLTSDTIYKSLK